MREITRPVQLSLPGGRLNPEAAGFTRTPLHLAEHLPSGAGHLWRTKRWDYWGITTDRFVLGLTLADLDYAAVLRAYFYDRLTGEEIAQEAVKTFAPARTVVLPDGLPPFAASGTVGALRMKFAGQPDGRVVLLLQSPRVQAVLEVDPGVESLGVVASRSRTRYRYTLKDLARPVTGTVEVDGQALPVDGPDAFATLDHGRGRWPHAASWDWAAGSGRNDGGRPVGLQLGAGRTEGMGATDNALFLNGRVHRRDGGVEFTHDTSDPEGPRAVRADWLDATLTPFHVRTTRIRALVFSGTTLQAFGRWSGRAEAPDGTKVSLDGLTGWVEETSNRW